MEGGKSKELLRIELNVFVLMYLLFIITSLQLYK